MRGFLFKKTTNTSYFKITNFSEYSLAKKNKISHLSKITISYRLNYFTRNTRSKFVLLINDKQTTTI